MQASPPFATISQALEALRAGKMLVVVDSPDRENEGDLIMAADCVTPQAINFMATHGRGLICLAITKNQAQKLALPPMQERNTSKFQTPFLVSIEAKEGITTGISAFDRAHTIKTAIAKDASPDDLCSPGHIFPLQAQDDGVLARKGHTEASVDLATLSGFSRAGVLCEIMNENGTMARVPDLILFSKQQNLLMITIEDLVRYRSAQR